MQADTAAHTTSTPASNHLAELIRFRDKANDDGLDYAIANHGDRLAKVDSKFQALCDAYNEARRQIAAHVGAKE